MDDLTGLQLSVIPSFDIGVDTQQVQTQQSVTGNQLQTVSLQNPQQIDNKLMKKKRPMNSFLLFCKDKREEALMQNPNLKSVDISPILAQQWKSLPDSERTRYKQMAAEQQRQFKEENPDYQYEKAKQKHMLIKQKGEPEQKLINVLDVKTLLTLPPEDIKAYMLFFSQQLAATMPGQEPMQQQFTLQDQTSFLPHDLTFHQD